MVGLEARSTMVGLEAQAEGVFEQRFPRQHSQLSSGKTELVT